MDRGTMTVKNQRIRCRRYCKLACRYSIKLTSRLLLPLLLAIFTVVITFEHKKDADRQRLEDRDIARIQRQEDRQSAREQRVQDLNQSILTRENDRNIADTQRQSDKERQKQELDLAEKRRNQDYELAEKARNSSDEQRKHELYIQEENRRDAQLAAYINEIGSLLEKNGGLLTLNRTVAAIARAKTLHISRSIGSTRSAQIIHFLYDADQLTVGKNPLDISGAYFHSIDLSISPLPRISLVGVHLNNVSFANVSEADFRNVRLSGCSFRQAICTHTTFERAIMTSVDFSHADLHSATFLDVQLSGVTFNRANCSNTIFERASMIQIDFSNANISYAKFHKVDLTQANFHASHALHKNGHLSFTQVKLDGANFSNSSLSIGRFIECSLVGADIRGAKLQGTNFEYCDLENVDFTGTSIIRCIVNRSSLAFATLKNSLLTLTKYPESNLSYANLSGACCGICNKPCGTECKFENVLSRQNTVLCNGTVQNDESLFVEGFVKCNRSVKNDRNIAFHFEESIIGVHSTDPTKCMIAPPPDGTGLQTLSVNISRFQYFIQTGDAAVVIRARMSLGITFWINNYNGKALKFHKTPIDELVQTKKNELNPNTKQLKLDLLIDSSGNSTPQWLDYIEVTIVPRAPRV